MPALLRFAPSPTGPLHLGGLRTALFNHLFALRHGGQWILRIEDTDAVCFLTVGADGRLKLHFHGRGLEWAGLQYNFGEYFPEGDLTLLNQLIGPGIDGPHAPYFQSKRLDLYHKYSKRLLESGDAYRCFCSPTKLDQTRKRLQNSGSTMTYDRTCLKMTDEEVARRVRAGEKHVVRINDTKSTSLTHFSDLIFGEVRDAQGSLPTDPILLKADLFPTYHLASVVDDHEMGITHVLRGEEWLPSLPLHRSLYARLGISEPRFGHLPLLLNPDGTKMSKRKSDVGVHNFMESNWEPSAVVNWLAIASRNINNPSLSSLTAATLPQLIEKFDLGDYTRRRAVLDPALLSQLNKAHIQQLLNSENPESQGSLLQRATQAVKEKHPYSYLTSPQYVGKVLAVLADRVERIKDLPEAGRIFFSGSLSLERPLPCDPTVYMTIVSSFSKWVLHSWDVNQLPQVLFHLPGSITDSEEGSKVSKRECMVILRHVLGGDKTGPPLADTLSLLGRAETLSRLQVLNVAVLQSPPSR